ncbi:MAG TPA: electron transfer flavoprotein subunit alpha/FixB family protein [Bryobacteraceae bacterium]|nr:electron transfer flavoprotein subunit alpha/FixB family protein [Bryobacteraceae bacterium]HOQ43868.1 electron transfer flavoprotein subunit alpha/FixB family protein [Bryobacteraceae bacterium]HPQ15444.1 electron transfer flavoprotein subunit alpha/FixB family protein [Bryobacteraceae bacterium]HPU71689.1 electron transfer flavoprotein subunit alpha/FixB family protein [Bryobacteraceae bacterium]
MSVLAILEQRNGAWSRMAWETLAAARQMARDLNAPVSAAVLGEGVAGLAQKAAGRDLETVWAVDHPLLKQYTPDAYTAALEALIRHAGPELVVFPHTYQVRDYAPRLAARFRRALLSDAVSHRVEDGKLVLVRQLFQGKLNADVRFATEPPNFVSVQAGAYRADEIEQGKARVETFTPPLDPAAVRTRPSEPFRETQAGVDLSSASIIVSVGRGIKEKENLAIVEKLAEALGAELAASRPICDNGWLPMERQVGSSGQTVAPKLYLAIGISGAIQHLVGMKGSRTIVAINKDAGAPIFEVADYGIVGDLFEVVPALTEEIRKIKA